MATGVTKDRLEDVIDVIVLFFHVYMTIAVGSMGPQIVMITKCGCLPTASESSS